MVTLRHKTCVNIYLGNATSEYKCVGPTVYTAKHILPSAAHTLEAHVLRAVHRTMSDGMCHIDELHVNTRAKAKEELLMSVDASRAGNLLLPILQTHQTMYKETGVELHTGAGFGYAELMERMKKVELASSRHEKDVDNWKKKMEEKEVTNKQRYDELKEQMAAMKAAIGRLKATSSV